MDPDDALKLSREICMSLPEATERSFHGSSAWYVQDKRQFAIFTNNHHNDGRLGLWIAAPFGAQASYSAELPPWFFVPPYVGYRGWIGVHLNKGISRDELTDLLAEAYMTVAPAKLAALLKPPG